ncbi:DUF6480 family protein [Streptomyces gobiensis]|uniref:DUF6480 family protein n=1 Tax=Streptomyces gobiensis TaxID=2875706 RepID=UPI001E49D8CE|nr:DUF6480 family protein [Streptomyces gobiensis]UGY94545.1 DUF6480 family protein [Streptomyces gobiensis]
MNENENENENEKNERDAETPDPEPKRTPGLEPGGSVPPGETPPAEGSMSEAGPQETHNPTRGWATGPMIVLAIVVAVFVIYYLARVVLRIV